MHLLYFTDMRDQSNKKIITMLILGVLVVAGIIGADLIKKQIGKTPDEQATENVALNFVPSGSVLSTDADNDGLMDWEEALRGTNPANPDSDGDGTNDGDEVRGSRNPLVAGPDDAAAPEGPVLYDDVAYTPGTLSEGIATSFISNYVLLDELGQLSEANTQDLGQQVAATAKAQAEIKDRYAIFDLKTFPDYDKEAATRYGNTFASIFIDYFVTLTTLKNTDDDLYVRAVASLYIALAEDLANIPVPDGASAAHVDFVNNANKVGQAILRINTGDQDPVAALFAIEQYQQAGSAQAQLFKDIANYFRANGILFSDDEPGTMWHNF